MTGKRRVVLTTLILNLAAHGLLFRSAPAFWAAAAALVACGGASGILLASLLTSASHRRLERVVVAIGAGYGVLVWITLYASYVPGALTRPLLLMLHAAVFLALALWRWRAPEQQPQRVRPSMPLRARPWELAGLLLLLALGAWLRFANLGFSEYQGDEATPVVRAAAVVQGYEDVLFLQRRGPADVVIPAAIMSLLDQTSEASLRLSFAFASLATILAVYVLGRRMFGGLAGWLAAALITVDGYFIGFGRVMHYESVVFLLAVVAVYLVYNATDAHRRAQSSVMNGAHFDARALTREMTLAAIVFATGLAAHYDGVVALLPMAVMSWTLWRKRADFVRGVAIPTLAGTILLASFFAPYLLHPSFQATYVHYAETLLSAEGIFVNNLLYFAESTALYDGALRFYLMLALLLAAVIELLRRQAVPVRWILGAATLMTLAALVTGADLLPWLAAATLLCIVAAPRLSAPERGVWLWLGLPAFQALFLTKTTGLHFYIFLAPWALLGGAVAAQLAQWLLRRRSEPAVRWLGAALAVICVCLAAVYPHRLFVQRSDPDAVTALRQPSPLWPSTAYTHGLMSYGMPHNSGWKAVGALYAAGELTGSYTSNADRWITTWYTRGIPRCSDQPAVVALARDVAADDAAELAADMGDHYDLGATLLVQGWPTLEIYQAGQATPVTLAAEELAQRFDQTLADAWLPLTAPAVTPKFTNVDYRMGDAIALTGFALSDDRASAGSHLTLTVRWRSLQPTNVRYTLFLQIIGPENRMIGQLDTLPSCDAGPTTDWEPGEEPIGYYRIPLFAGEQPGNYPLLVGLYDAQTQTRLPIVDGQGVAQGDAVTLTNVQVTAP